MRKLMIAIVATTAITAAAPAQQARPAEQVRFADLDLRSDAGKRALARRIGRATESVCGSYAGLRDDAEIVALDACRAQARIEGARQLAAILEPAVRSASR